LRIERIALGRHYEMAAWTVLAENGVQVRRWSEAGEGYAYVARGERVIDAPRPRSAAAFAVLCHEVAHHALGHTEHPEWADARRELEEEGAAWEFTFACFARFGFTLPAAVTRAVAASMAEHLAAALEEGLDPIPPRFRPFEPAARALLAARPGLGYNENGGEPPSPLLPP
jgi:hypothetical protein